MSRPPPVPGAVVVGRYRLVHPVGRGGTGEVWRAYDRRTRREVALKLLPVDPWSAALQRHVREQALRLPHPHLATPIGWAADEDLVIVVTELARGGSVDLLLREHGPLPEPFVVCLVDQVLDALSSLHGLGLVHRDVTPSNLLLDPGPFRSPHCSLADFGISAETGSPLGAGEPSGTPCYLPPEAVSPSPGALVHPAQDMWAVGVLIRHLLTGSPAPPSGSGTGGLDPLVRRLLAPDPADRPDAASARAFLAALDLPRRPDHPDLRIPDRCRSRSRRSCPWPAPTTWLLLLGCLVLSVLSGWYCLVRLLSWPGVGGGS